MSYARLSKKPLLSRSFTGLEISEFNATCEEIESKYNEHESVFLSRRKSCYYSGKKKKEVYYYQDTIYYGKR